MRQYFLNIIMTAVVTLFTISIARANSSGHEDKFTIVIDAGHGGKDPGSLGKNINEKTVNLGVAMKLGKLIEESMPDVKVVYTRKTDVFVPLQKRADIANKASGNLFVSIHANSVAQNNPLRSTVSGASVYVLGCNSEANLEVAKRENAVMMLEDDYTTTYKGFDPNSTESNIAFELLQNNHMNHSLMFAGNIQSELVKAAGRKDNGVKQGMFWVLVKTGMPSVLIELDYICNPTCERYMASESGQMQLAEAIYNGFRAYKTTYDKEIEALNHDSGSVRNGNGKVGEQSGSQSKPEKPTTPAKVDTPSKSEVVYKVQFMTSPKRFDSSSSVFKGLEDVDCYKDEGVYKYTVGNYPTMPEASRCLTKVKKHFPDAFIIRMRDGKRIK